MGVVGSKEYSSQIDMWGVGCILFEMLTRKAMFPGSTTDEQLNLIFQTLGTPTPERAASLLNSPNFKALNLRPSKPRSLTKMSPRIDSQSADLLEKFLKASARYQSFCYDINNFSTRGKNEFRQQMQ